MVVILAVIDVLVAVELYEIHGIIPIKMMISVVDLDVIVEEVVMMIDLRDVRLVEILR